MTRPIIYTYGEITKERNRQDEIWGGPEHDDTHTPEEWRSYIQYQINNMSPSDRMTSAILDEDNYRTRLIRIAALAVAAIQSLDRKKG
jgi:hypothetical protein